MHLDCCLQIHSPYPSGPELSLAPARTESAPRAIRWPAQTQKTLKDELTYHQAQTGWQFIDLDELWKFRDLVWAFGLRDLKVRYRQTTVGIAWAIIQPLFTVIVFGTLITWLRGTATDGSIPYAVTTLCGMVPWQFFAATVTQATLSIAINGPLLKKVYFPRVILPLSTFIPASVDFLVSALMLLIVMIVYAIVPSWKIVFLPLALGGTLICAAAFALWLSAINAIYRDVQYAVPFFLQLGMIVCPVVYETQSVVPQEWQTLYYLNPLATLIQCYRAILLDAEFPGLIGFACSIFTMTLLLCGGIAYFRRMERRFADIV